MQLFFWLLTYSTSLKLWPRVVLKTSIKLTMFHCCFWIQCFFEFNTKCCYNPCRKISCLPVFFTSSHRYAGIVCTTEFLFHCETVLCIVAFYPSYSIESSTGFWLHNLNNPRPCLEILLLLKRFREFQPFSPLLICSWPLLWNSLLSGQITSKPGWSSWNNSSAWRELRAVRPSMTMWFRPCLNRTLSRCWTSSELLSPILTATSRNVCSRCTLWQITQDMKLYPSCPCLVTYFLLP